MLYLHSSPLYCMAHTVQLCSWLQLYKLYSTLFCIDPPTKSTICSRMFAPLHSIIESMKSILIRYASFSNSVLSEVLSNILQNVRIVLILLQSLQLLSLPWTHEAVLLQIVTYAAAVVENGMENKSEFGRTMMGALELQWLAKRHISAQSNVE